VNEVAWADEGEYYPEEEEEATYDDRWGLDQTDTSLDDPQWAGLDLPTYDVAVLDGGMPDFA
jgi:hypothetical protein